MKRTPRSPRRSTSVRKRPRRQDSLEALTRQELLLLAKERNIRGRHRMTRVELVNALKIPANGSSKKTAIPLQKPADQPALRDRYQELPGSYEVTELALLPIDPYRIFAYWEVTPQALTSLSSQLGYTAPVGQYTIRVYDVTAIEFNGSNAHSFFDLPIDLQAKNWYINLWSGEKSLVADLGYLMPDGRFFLLARSNMVQTPRSGVSIFTDARWAAPFAGPARLRFHDEEPSYWVPPAYPLTGLTLWEKLSQESSTFSSGPGQPSSAFHSRTQSRQEKL